jgi:hypothetical protein
MRKAIITTIASAAGALALLTVAGHRELAEAKPVNCNEKLIGCQKRCTERYGVDKAPDCWLRTCEKQLANCKGPQTPTNPKGNAGGGYPDPTGGYDTQGTPRPKGVPAGGGYDTQGTPRPKGIPAGGGYDTQGTPRPRGIPAGGGYDTQGTPSPKGSGGIGTPLSGSVRTQNPAQGANSPILRSERGKR